MSTTGLEVFDKTLQTTHIWLDEITDTVGPDRNAAWHILGAVLRTLRDRLPLGLAAHLGAQLPLVVRGAYYDQFRPGHAPEKFHTFDEFVERVGDESRGVRSVDVRAATLCVFAMLDRHITPEQLDKVRRALPESVRRHWMELAALV